jgi:hypothetical protein
MSKYSINNKLHFWPKMAIIRIYIRYKNEISKYIIYTLLYVYIRLDDGPFWSKHVVYL